MPTLIVLFNLKSDASNAEYENWAKTTDLPTVKGLKSVDDFKLYRLGHVLGTENAAPYQYCEVIAINDLNGLFADIGTPLMQKVAAEFQGFADGPVFILADGVE